MLLDSHMHVGDFPYFNVSIDRDGLVASMREHGIDTGMVFHPDNRLVRDIVAADARPVRAGLGQPA